MEMNYAKTVEKWGTLEVAVKGPKEGNPFCDQWIKGTFECKNEKKTVDGFYDGDGVYKVRFMPSFVDTYTFKIESSFQTACSLPSVLCNLQLFCCKNTPSDTFSASSL